MSGDDILVTERLGKSFGGFAAVSDVNLKVRRGSIHALIGPNGAGKTTCFNLLTKFVAPSFGRILFNGRDITATRPADVARLGLARSFQISAIFPHLTALENVRVALQRQRGDSFDFWRSKNGADAAQRARAGAARCRSASPTGPIRSRSSSPMAASARWRSPRRWRSTPRCCCSTNRWRASASRTSTASPALIRRVSANRTILMVEHNLQVVADLCDRITVLTRGRVLAEGDYRAVSANQQVRQAYMGDGHGYG